MKKELDTDKRVIFLWLADRPASLVELNQKSGSMCIPMAKALWLEASTGCFVPAYEDTAQQID